MHDLVIRNGRVIDGAETPAFTADIAIDDGRITAVGVVSGISSFKDQTGADGAPGVCRLSDGVVSISSGTASKRSTSWAKPA